MLTKKILLSALICGGIALCFNGLAAGGVLASEIRVFAAASTAGAFGDVARAFERSNPAIRISEVYASSSTLAKQIVNGAPADIFISANRRWMDYAVQEGGVETSTVTDLLTNRLVLVAPPGTDWTVDIGPGFDLLGRLTGGYLAMGDPAHVPAGIYGHEALETLGVWKTMSGRIAQAADARAALVLVERGEAAAGIVYATDAKISGRVRVVGTFPEETHSPIVYPAALSIASKAEDVRAFFRFLGSAEAGNIWARHGFALARYVKPR